MYRFHHGVSHDVCIQQASMPQRLSGCGLENSVRSSAAAYWASWADALSVISSRFPAMGARAKSLARGRNCWSALRQQGLDMAASLGSSDCRAATAWPRPWRAVSRGVAARMAVPHQQLYRDSCMGKTYVNARSTGTARVWSCIDRFSAAWLTAYPNVSIPNFKKMTSCTLLCACDSVWQFALMGKCVWCAIVL